MFDHYCPSLLNASETIDCGRSMSRTIETHCYDNSYLASSRVKILDAIGTIEAFQGRGKSNPLKVKQNELKENRKLLISAIDSGVESKLKQALLDPDSAKSAESIASICNDTPIKYNVSQLVTINQVNTRIRRLDTVANRAHLKKIDVLVAFDKLIEIETALEAISNEIDALESTKLRGTVDEHVNILKSKIAYVLPYFDSNCQDDPKVYAAPAKEIAETISRVMTVARMRLGKKSDDVKPIDVKPIAVLNQHVNPDATE